MNSSALDVVEVPPPTVTVTSTRPVPAGSVAVICVDELTVKLVAAVLPNLTAVAPVKLAPDITTVVPPAEVPVLGLKPETTGVAT